ncbi:hypothetical protein CLOM_g17188 [Closterium sp. NIES-68]|nr:hypothetical protein CLOM_g17188 [Closterium sp. NIES-68]GJP63210.1 hypothetical protein CLOP_g20273 [Closterium sp. NIES-67]
MRSSAMSAPRFPPLLNRPPLPLIVGALFALLLLGLYLSSPPTPSLPTNIPAHDRLANFRPVSEVRWAIIGCGDVTEKKSGPALSLIPYSRLVMVMRRNGSLAQDYAERHKVARWSTSAEETINHPDVNAVYIATPHRYHAQYAMMAAQAGKPAYVEKPMGMSHVDSSAILSAFQRAKLPLFVAYYRRALPNFLRIKALLQSGAIGDVLSVQVVYHRPPNKYDYQWAISGVPSQRELQTMLQEQQQQQQQQQGEGNGKGKEDGAQQQHQQQHQQRQYPHRPPPQHHPAGASLYNASLKWRVDPLVGGLGGYFRDKGSHHLDLLDFWFGPIVAASGWSTNLAGLYPSPDTITAHFRFFNGIVGTGSWNFAAGKSSQQEYGEITGSSGRIKFQFFLSNKVELWNDTGHHEWDDPSPTHVQQPLLATVVSALRGAGECPSEGESAIRTSFILDKIVTGEKWP